MTKDELLRHRRTKGAETDRFALQKLKPALYSTHDSDPMTPSLNTVNRNDLTRASETFIRALLGRQMPKKAHVYLFGSRARQQAHWNADYDLWIDADLPDGLLSRLQEELEESFVPFKVDIVTTSQLHGPFGDQVRKEAVPWM